MKRLLLLVTVLTALGACTRTSGTVEIPPQELPFPVARAATSTETPVQRRNFTVYFVRNDRLVGVQRVTDVGASAAEVSLRALLEGPNPADRRAGITSELPADVRLLEVPRGGTTILVDLSGEFQAPAPPLGIALRVAQVVWTLTELSGVSEVLFSIDGETVEIATGDGTVVGRAVNRSDYASFSPP